MNRTKELDTQGACGYAFRSRTTNPPPFDDSIVGPLTPTWQGPAESQALRLSGTAHRPRGTHDRSECPTHGEPHLQRRLRNRLDRQHRRPASLARSCRATDPIPSAIASSVGVMRVNGMRSGVVSRSARIGPLGIGLTRIDTARPYPTAADTWRAMARRMSGRPIQFRDHQYFVALTSGEFERAARIFGVTRAEIAAALWREGVPLPHKEVPSPPEPGMQ